MKFYIRAFYRHSLALILLVLIVMPPTVSALQVAGLYTYRVKVDSESNSERTRAFQNALSAVIIKVTGDQRWLLDPLIIEAIDNAQSFVEGVSYSTTLIETISEEVTVSEEDAILSETLQDSLSSETETLLDEASIGPQPQSTDLAEDEAPRVTMIEQRYVEVNFSATLIDELLVGANIPLWDSNRPSVLVWMALQNEVGDRSFLSDESNPEIVALITEFAQERGLPVIFPVFDFEDQRNLPVDVMWSLDNDAIKLASNRYGADSILAGRLHFTAGGELVGLWQFDFQDEAELFDGFDNDIESYLNAPLDRVTTTLANYFGVIPQDSNLLSIRLRIEGIQDLEDYSLLINYVSNLGNVESVTMSALEAQQLELDISLSGDSAQLHELIGLDRDLLPIQNSAIASASLLHYRWTR